MTEHAPGPWKNNNRVIEAANGMPVSRVYGVNDFLRIDDDSNLDQHNTEYEANARLIAAAPDLLAACEFALAIAESRTIGTWDDVMLEMRRVVKKAGQP